MELALETLHLLLFIIIKMYMGFAEMKQTKCLYHTKTISFNKVQKYKYLLQINALLTDAITEAHVRLWMACWSACVSLASLGQVVREVSV